MSFTPNWKLITDLGGRQTWQFCPRMPYCNFSENDWLSEDGQRFLTEMSAGFYFDKSSNANSADSVYRSGMFDERMNSKTAAGNSGDPFFDAVNYYQNLQALSGHWPGDYGGPMFLLPGLIITSYVTETPLPAAHGALMRQYMLNHQNNDGGWGLHIEGASCMFGTILQYVSLRILGANTHDIAIKNAAQWIKKNGGATGMPLWGKFYLALLGVYEWQGVNPILPELLLMPQWLPFHPSNYWCHARMVYLPMAYCYAARVTGKITPLVKQLREEIYLGPYAYVNWIKARSNCAATDLHYPETNILKGLNKLLNSYEKKHVTAWRKKALDFALDYINAEDEQTNFIDIGPVNQVVNSVCVWHAYGKNDDRFKKHVDRWFDYLWVAEDGMKMNGYNGSQLWDTAFAVQAILEGDVDQQFSNTLIKANEYIVHSQVREEVKGHSKFYRHDSVGGWPFSTNQHGWPITDCTAEGLKASLSLRESGIEMNELVPDELLQQAASLLLSFQNADGGWASYELTRAPRWLEAFNPSAIFGNIMIDYSYTECSSACVQALIKFRQVFPHYKNAEIEKAIKRGVDFILAQQLKDGSWYGSWAVCFTYGTWFGVEALAAFKSSGIIYGNPSLIDKSLEQAQKFLISNQKPDGGWGESFESCTLKRYIQHPQSQVVNTGWALLSLMLIRGTGNKSVIKGIEFLEKQQLPDGDFGQQSVSGVFNHSCGITYTAYRNVFPIWALGRYKRLLAKGKVSAHTATNAVA